jgi:hypothetical protein
MAEIHQDNLLTHSVLNFLRASFVGQLIFHKTLKDLGSDLVPDTYLENAHRALDKLDPWIEELRQGIPIISASWSAPETFEAIRAFSYLKDLKQDLTWLSSQLAGALAVKDLTSQPQATKLLVAGIARTANVRAAYLEGAVDFLRTNQDGERADMVAYQLEDARSYANVAQYIIETFTPPPPFHEELTEKLRREAELTPHDFAAQIHDVVLLQNAFNKKFGYEHLELGDADLLPWEQRQIPAPVTGYWISYKLSPDECIAWSNIGIGNAAFAANWKRAGFDHETAQQWLKVGFSPALARLWLSGGYDAERAAQMVQRGIMSPEQQQPEASGQAEKAPESE